MKLETLFNCSLLHFIGDTQYELCRTMLRFQEFYESPEFKNKIFTLGEFRKWYVQQYGSFSYYKDWSGFNFPAYIVYPFYNGLFDPLLKEEQYIVDKVTPYIQNDPYIIGTYDGDEDDIFIHELCHAFYYLDRKYRDRVNSFIDNNYNAFEDLITWISNNGYSFDKEIIFDEVNAYVSTDNGSLNEKDIDISAKYKATLKRMFDETYNNFSSAS